MDELSSLLEQLYEKRLSFKKKKSLSSSDYAFPRLKKLPLIDAAHVRNAMARFNQTQGMTPEERRIAIKRIIAAAKRFGIKADEFIKKYGGK